MTISEHLQHTLDTLPTRPGCYLMKDEDGTIIYVGKAVNLRSRVRSYFHAQTDSAKTDQLVRRIADIETIIVDSELEALILEMNLIKKHRPKYNVRLKDDKRYPYIKVHWADPFPKVTVTRQMNARDGSRYFGPYTSVWAVHQTLALLRKIFGYLTCDRVITGHDPRACLYYDIKLCIAPCIGAASKDDYRAMIDDLCKFLQGRTEPVVKRLRAEMEAASEALQFEKAAAIRDQLLAIERVVEKQKVISTEQIDSDVIAFARDKGDTCAQVFFIRGGKLIGRESFMLEGAAEAEPTEIVSHFITQFYEDAAFVPQEVMLPTDIAEAEIVSQWLRDKRGGDKVTLTVPHRGPKHDLIEMATTNAAEALTRLHVEREADASKHVEAMAELQAALGLPRPPTRIECFDISHLQGTATVASMVVFTQGAPEKQHYRSFNIRTVAGVDDFASMREVLRRRFGRWRETQEIRETKEKGLAPGKKIDESFALLPDLLLIDGGKGQLGEAVAALKEFELTERVPVASLAKQREEIFLPGQPNSIMMPRNSPGLFLVQRVRDEAHRFAVTHNRQQRQKAGLASQLEAIPGVGPARRKALLKQFGDVDGIRAASAEELQSVKGVTAEVAKAIKENL
ncbi:MAG TPA: excinuclease ABC subunit UvrC [Anaerolineales bacterium]|nr:excinuclease ABC subunit UvrC [Anaerolineales bacterium]